MNTTSWGIEEEEDETRNFGGGELLFPSPGHIDPIEGGPEYSARAKLAGRWIDCVQHRPNDL